jgi:uncharacterized membrane protein YqjE
MIASEHQPPGMLGLLQRLTRTGVGALQNRVELLVLEWQEERVRLGEMLVWAVCLVFLAIMALLLLTGTIILLCPARGRVYVAAGFAVLYLAGAVGAWIAFKGLLKRDPFPETLNQLRKDRAWLDSLK